MIQDAPLFADLAQGPDAGRGFWLKTADGVRIRAGLWAGDAPRGTVLLFPGRTEYIEKYGVTASDLAARGYATFSVDWRGQGLADRLTRNPLAGHVKRILDYQLDVAAMIEAAEHLNLPRPWHVLGHSMGGAIGLRALLQGLPVASASFSAPMWGIELSPPLRALAWSLSSLGSWTGFGWIIAPGSTRTPYVLTTDFKDNLLTNDREMYQRMIDHLTAEPSLSLAGPTLRWLNQALWEVRWLAQQPSPPTPCLTLMGSDEAIVLPSNIRQRMQHWPNGKLIILPGGRHEVLEDTPQMRTHAASLLCDHFDQHAGDPSIFRT